MAWVRPPARLERRLGQWIEPLHVERFSLKKPHDQVYKHKRHDVYQHRFTTRP